MGSIRCDFFRRQRSRHGAQPAPPTSRRTQLEFGRRPRALPFGPLSKALIVLSDPQHRDFSLRIIHLIRKNPRFFCDFLPAAAWRPRDTEQSPLKVAVFNSLVQSDLRHVCVGKKHCPTIVTTIAWTLFTFARRL